MINRRSVTVTLALACMAALTATPASAADAPAKCEGHTVTIRGTAGYDTLRGTSGVDVIHGGAGKDDIFGYGNNDIICGGAGADTIRGGHGVDRIYGQTGSDVIRDRRNAKIWGGYGTDSISLTEPGSDSYVNAGPDPDYIFIDLAIGKFTVNGSLGNDRFYYGATAGHDQVEDDDENVTINLGGQSATTRNAAITVVNIEGAQGGSGDDRVYGDPRGNWLDGGPAGDDAIFGRGGNDWIYGDNGSNDLTGGSGEDQCFDYTPYDPNTNIDCEYIAVDPDVENEG